jgi:hypothetical protein
MSFFIVEQRDELLLFFLGDLLLIERRGEITHQGIEMCSPDAHSFVGTHITAFIDTRAPLSPDRLGQPTAL